jgi:ATP-binding cassette, subfamily B, bacterial
MYFFGKGMNHRSVAAHQTDSKVTSLVQQNIAALPLVQSYTQEKREQSRFAQQVQDALEKRTTQHRFEVIYWLIIALLFGAGTALLTWWGAREILQKNLTVGELTIFLAYLAQLYEPLNQLTNVGATVADAGAGVDRIFEILDTRDDITAKSGSRVITESHGEVEFQNVQFGYNPETPVLKDITLRINAGETVGIIGPSGAGKTTLLNLLTRFYDPQHGRVLLDQVDIRELHLRSLREQIAFVFQEPLLLPATVAENISYGRPKASMQEIREAARLANAEQFITQLPQQFETIVGEGAARLSLGEKQRINIARAFLKNAPILLLDEPTSALDAESEAQVVESLIRLLEGRTTLMVAHRLTTIKQVDRIIVLDSGAIIESGSPRELLDRNGYYTRITSRSFGKV